MEGLHLSGSTPKGPRLSPSVPKEDSGSVLLEQVLPAVRPGGCLGMLLRLCSSDRLMRDALHFAALRLRARERGSTHEPALLHGVRVAALVAILFQRTSPKTVSAALLHDLLEDTETSEEDLRQRFGSEVSTAVVTLTKPEVSPKSKRRQCYFDGILAASDDVILIKLADCYDNLQCRRGTARFEKCRRSASQFLARLEKERKLCGPLQNAACLVKPLLGEVQADWKKSSPNEKSGG